MKTKHLLPLAIILPISLCLHAQELKAPAERGSASTYIPSTLEVPTFTPPAPVVQKRLPAIRVEAATTTRLANGKTLTLQRGEPSTEPDLPLPPPPAPPTVARALTQQEIADNIWQQRHNLSLGATIFDHQTSLIHWTDPVSLVRYEAVCGFDVGLLDGLGGFVHRGEDYSLFLMHSHHSTAEPEPYSQEMLEEIPKIAPGEIRITTGDARDPNALALLQALREVIELEKPRLLVYQAQREKYFQAATAWHAAHPPVPKDETFILRPHRGSRYLTTTNEKGSAR
jgi:hypothetical protein